MKYPYIASNENGTIVLFNTVDCGFLLKKSQYSARDEGFWYSWNEATFKNITREYLANTYGKVESKEHADFIVELAEANGVEADGLDGVETCFSIDDDGLYFWVSKEKAMEYGEKPITTPMPEVKTPKSDEWPQVGDEVETKGGCKGVLKLDKPDKDGMVVCDFNGEYGLTYKDKLKKPKTPDEELRDDVVNIIARSNAHWSVNKKDMDLCVESYVAGQLMAKYNITKKP